MYSPALHSLFVQANVEDQQRAAQTCDRRSDANRPALVPLSVLIQRAISRVFVGASAVNDEAAPAHGFELVGPSSAATLRPRS